MGLIEILRDRVGRPVEPSGADLYRLNCQSCHRAEGTGSPPEIKSVLGLVQGSPLELVRQHLQKEGMPSAGSAARAPATRARADLYQRIQKGGQSVFSDDGGHFYAGGGFKVVIGR